MTCLNCGYEFSEEQSREACGKCGHFGGCNLVMCPKCSYEQPRIPKWVAKIAKVFDKKDRLKTK